MRLKICFHFFYECTFAHDDINIHSCLNNNKIQLFVLLINPSQINIFAMRKKNLLAVVEFMWGFKEVWLLYDE